MNPQFAPQQQQQFGVPPPSQSPQVYQQNRASPGLGLPPSNFQSVPLGPPPTTSASMNPTLNNNPMGILPTQLPPAMNSNLKSQIPSGQLPPIMNTNQNQFGPPSIKSNSGGSQLPPSSSSTQFQNGPPQFQNGPNIQNGPGFGSTPLTNSQYQTSNMPPMGQPRSHIPGQPPLPGQNINQSRPMQHPPMPPTSQPLQQPPMPPTSQSLQPPMPPTSQPIQQPPMPPTSQSLQPPMPPTSQPIQQPPMPPTSQPLQPPMPPTSQPLQQPSMPPTSQSIQPPIPPTSQPLQPSMLPASQSSQPPMPPTSQSLPPMNQPPFLNQSASPGHPPLPGQAYKPMPNRMPPGPNQFNQQHQALPPRSLPGQIPPNQYQNSSPLVNQMQNMNLGGPGRYPAMKNGDTGPPHMPPPLNQQYINGQQSPQQQQRPMRGPPAPGYPPMPGQQPIGGGGGAYSQSAYPQPQEQPKRLDPDQMPSPVQVTQDDQQSRSGIFCTNQKGLVPPLVTTNFIVQDQGNASPRFIRSTMYNVPISQDIMKQTAVPFSLVISPMARTLDGEYPPPIVDFGELGPVRCIRCKAYMCPYMQFIDSGRRFQCLFCKATTDVPNEYFQHLDHTGQRLDRYERPELVLGTYEFVATSDYCRNNQLPKPPAIIFVIDVSYNNIKSGLVHLLCSQMKEIIKNLPVDQGHEKSNMKVGFITYNSSVHFYNIKGTLAAPQMLVVGDVQDMFMPLLDGFLCTPEESGPIIDALMEQIPAMFGDTRETETILLPAILAGLEALKASECAGKLLVFHSTLPTAEAPGRLKNRDDRKLLGTDKERTVLTPQNQAYNQLGQDCVGSGCSVDLFIFNNAYIDIATIGQVSRLSGGEVFKYTYFQADIDGDRLIHDIITDISRPIAFDAIMRVRTSTGVRPTDFYGHFFMTNTTDMELASIDCDKAVVVEIKHDDKLSEEEGVYIQAALLYTSCSGQRRLRIINLSLKTCSQMADLYRSCECDTIINYISKQATFKLLENNPKAVKDSIVTRAAQILATYRKNCATPSSAGQLILPECMKLLPLYVNCLLKSDAISGGSDITLDDRSYVMQQVMIMDVPTSVNYFYPRLIPLHDLDLDKEIIEIPSPIRCTVDKMSDQGVYILENGIHMFLWIGLGANPDFIQKVFGVPSAIQVEIDRVHLPELDNPLSNAVRTIIDEIRVQRHRWMRLTIVRQREKLEPVFKHFLAEDRGTDGSPSYIDFLIHMHKEIRVLLS